MKKMITMIIFGFFTSCASTFDESQLHFFKEYNAPKILKLDLIRKTIIEEYGPIVEENCIKECSQTQECKAKCLQKQVPNEFFVFTKIYEGPSEKICPNITGACTFAIDSIIFLDNKKTTLVTTVDLRELCRVMFHEHFHIFLYEKLGDSNNDHSNTFWKNDIFDVRFTNKCIELGIGTKFAQPL